MTNLSLEQICSVYIALIHSGVHGYLSTTSNRPTQICHECFSTLIHLENNTGTTVFVLCSG